MRRKDREITELKEIIAIMKACDSMSLALCDEDYPYVVPLNFGFLVENDKVMIYFHGADAGKKMALIRKNPKVAFTMHCNHLLVEGEKSCDYSFNYRSVCGKGEVHILEEAEKRQALEYLMRQYAPEKKNIYDEKVIEATAVCCISVTELTGKQRK